MDDNNYAREQEEPRFLTEIGRRMYEELTAANEYMENFRAFYGSQEYCSLLARCQDTSDQKDIHR